MLYVLIGYTVMLMLLVLVFFTIRYAKQNERNAKAAYPANRVGFPTFPLLLWWGMVGSNGIMLWLRMTDGVMFSWANLALRNFNGVALLGAQFLFLGILSELGINTFLLTLGASVFLALNFAWPILIEVQYQLLTYFGGM